MHCYTNANLYMESDQKIWKQSANTKFEDFTGQGAQAGLGTNFKEETPTNRRKLSDKTTR